MNILLGILLVGSVFLISVLAGMQIKSNLDKKNKKGK